MRGRRSRGGVTLLHSCAVLILVYECPHTTVCVLIPFFYFLRTTIYVAGARVWCDAAAQLRYICVLRLVYTCPHTTIYMWQALECGVTLLHSYEKASDYLDWIIGTHGVRFSVGGLKLLVYEALSY